MEIHTNSSWKKLCTSTWNKVEVDLTCMAMGYSNSSDYGRWYEDSGNVSETSTNFNCTTTLTKCEESFTNKLQFCKGINQLCILDSIVRSISVFTSYSRYNAGKMGFWFHLLRLKQALLLFLRAFNFLPIGISARSPYMFQWFVVFSCSKRTFGDKKTRII